MTNVKGQKFGEDHYRILLEFLLEQFKADAKTFRYNRAFSSFITKIKEAKEAASAASANPEQSSLASLDDVFLDAAILQRAYLGERARFLKHQLEEDPSSTTTFPNGNLWREVSRIKNFEEKAAARINRKRSEELASLPTSPSSSPGFAPSSLNASTSSASSSLHHVTTADLHAVATGSDTDAQIVDMRQFLRDEESDENGAVALPIATTKTPSTTASRTHHIHARATDHNEDSDEFDDANFFGADKVHPKKRRLQTAKLQHQVDNLERAVDTLQKSLSEMSRQINEMQALLLQQQLQ